VILPGNIYLFTKYKALFWLCVFVFISRANSAIGQKLESPKKFIHSTTFTTEYGLSQNNVSCIVKDTDGFMWIGTGDGLNRFDGYSFIQFVHSDKDSSSLSNDVIRNLLIDSKDRLWIGTYNGLNLFDSEKETFRKFLKSSTDDNTISQNTILDLIEDRNHQLWVGTYGGLNKINLETFEITHYYYNEDGTGLPSNAINALLEDRNGKIWACTGKGICIIGPKGIEKTIPQSSEPDGLPADLVVGIVQDSSGAIFLGTNGSGVVRLEDETDHTFEQFEHVVGKATIGSNVIATLSLDRNGKLLVGTDGAGLFQYEGGETFTQILSRENKTLDNGGIHEIYPDEQNNYWLGLFGAGLTFVPVDHRRFEHYQFFDANMERLGKNSVLGIAEDHDQKIWIGTDGAGLYKFDPATKSFTSYLHSPENKNSVSTNVVKSLLVDEKNNLYIGTYAGGLNYFDTKKNIFYRYLHNPNDPNSIATNHVWSLLQDTNKRIYIGQLGGLNEFLPESKTFKTLTIAGGTVITSYTASIFSMVEDKQGNIWMGTRLAGIHRYEPKTGTFKSFINIPGDSLSLPTNEVLELRMDSNGKLLIGTDNQGLIQFDTETFTYKKLINDFQEKNIPSILEDNSNNLWFTSFDGLHKYDPATGAVYNYTVTDGLQGHQFNEGARLKSSTGEYYFGGTNGLNIFRPEKIVEDFSKPSVEFTRLNLFHNLVKINDKSGLLTKSITKLESITFQPDQNVFSVEFTCLEYKFPKKNKYQYYLDGFDKDWNDANDSRTATYTNLPPGEYTLKVRASNGNGYWNEDAASIQIIVIPRWYQRLDVQIAFAFLILAITFSLIHIRTKFLLKEKNKLELKVITRTKLIETQKEEIRDKNEKLEQANEEVNTVNEELQRVNVNLEKLVENRTEELRFTIKKLIESDEGLNTFLYRSSHDLRGPIASLMGLARVAEMQNNQEELVPYFGNMEKVATRMLRLLNRLNDAGALFRAKRQMEVIDVNNFIQSIEAKLKTANTDDTIKIEFDNQAGQSLLCDPTLLNHIIVNLMENSIVFRGVSHPFATCVLSTIDHQLVVQVTDNGTGISAEVRDRIFEMFYRGSEKSVGNGLGLFLVKKSLEILEGTIEINSEPNLVTVVKVWIPLNHVES
jgi:ligand-binding sensor domain-containing protein/signal transduction histidine kinase